MLDNPAHGLWSVASSHAGLVGELARVPWKPSTAPAVPVRRMADGVAVVTVAGLLLKRGSDWLGIPGCVDYRGTIESLADDETAAKVIVVFDSPGGTVSGVDDLAETVRRAASKKPVIAFCEDLCASAAYWVASQCTEVYANRSAMVGSIGVYRLVYDDSKGFEADGVKAHLIKSADFKGAGAPGAKIEDRHLAEWQRQVDDTHARFTTAIRSARAKVDTKSFDGRLYGARDAVRLGLIDGIATFDQAVSGRAHPGPAGRPVRVAVTPKAPSATERVEAAIAAGIASGQSRQAVIMALRASDPKLIAAWCCEASEAGRCRR